MIVDKVRCSWSNVSKFEHMEASEMVYPTVQLRSHLLDIETACSCHHSMRKLGRTSTRIHMAPYKECHHILAAMVMPYRNIQVHKRKQREGNSSHTVNSQATKVAPKYRPSVGIGTWKLCPLTSLEQTHCLPEWSCEGC